MKRTVLSLTAALAILLSLFTAQPARAAAWHIHDGQTFNIAAGTFLKHYRNGLEYNDCDYTFSLNEPFSDCNAQYYDMYDPCGNYEMTMVLYTNYETKLLETVRFYCAADSISQVDSDGRLFAMKVAYVQSNPDMTQDKWARMFSEETAFDSGYCRGFYGEFDGVRYFLNAADGSVEFSIS